MITPCKKLNPPCNDLTTAYNRNVTSYKGLLLHVTLLTTINNGFTIMHIDYNTPKQEISIAYNELIP